MTERFTQRLNKLAGENGPNGKRIAELKVELEAFRRNRDRHVDDGKRIVAIEKEITDLGGTVPEWPVE